MFLSFLSHFGTVVDQQSDTCVILDQIILIMKGRPVHCGIFSSILGLNPLDSQSGQHKCLHTGQVSPGRRAGKN